RLASTIEPKKHSSGREKKQTGGEDRAIQLSPARLAVTTRPFGTRRARVRAGRLRGGGAVPAATVLNPAARPLRGETFPCEPEAPAREGVPDPCSRFGLPQVVAVRAAKSPINSSSAAPRRDERISPLRGAIVRTEPEAPARVGNPSLAGASGS